MLKTIGFILLIIIFVMMFVPQARDLIGSPFFGKQGKGEEKVIGPVSGFNPRVKEVQNVLKDLGMYSGPADGNMNSQTRASLKAFQNKKGLKATGKVDESTWTALNKEKKQIKPQATNPPAAKSTQQRVSPVVLKQQKEAEDTAKLKSRAVIQDEIIGYRLKSKERTKEVQTALTKAGFYKGEADGKMGSETKAAIKAFQKARGLNPDGVAGPKTFEVLKEYMVK